MIKRIQSIFIRENKAAVIQDFSSPIIVNAKLLEAYSVSCKCGSIAIPTGERGETYQCIRCGKQPEGPRYNLGQRVASDSSFNPLPKPTNQLLHLDFYNDAVELLKRRKR